METQTEKLLFALSVLVLLIVAAYAVTVSGGQLVVTQTPARVPEPESSGGEVIESEPEPVPVAVAEPPAPEPVPVPAATEEVTP